VERYIAKVTPVPSQVIFSDCELGVSPATIRNDMARLEEAGYITRPHPSAGSVPSDKGYRYYVEALTGVTLPLAERRLIDHLFHQVEREEEDWLRLAATVMAQLARNVAVVSQPKSAGSQFKHMELISLQDSLVLVVLVLHGARVRQQLVNVEPAVSQSELSATANRINEAYSGLTISQISAKELELSPAEQQLAACLESLMRAEDEPRCREAYLDGLHFTLNQPEFARSQRVLDLMEMVEHRSLLQAIFPQELGIGEVQVVVGRENRAEAIHNCSVVIAEYGLPEEATGIIGVVGPTRMPYARTISAVTYLSSVLSRLVAGLYGGETPAGERHADTN
jgi:heat-inducible transcriptional repressor